MLARLLVLIKKEFLAIWKDPRSRFIVTIMPIIQMIVFVNAITMEVKNIDMLVLDQSNSAYSRELLSHLHSNSLFRNIEMVNNKSEIEDKMGNQEAAIALEIPVDFAAGIRTGRGTSVQLIVDGRQTNSAAIGGGYVSQIINAYNEQLAGSSPKVDLVVRNWFNVNLDYKYTSIVSLLALLSMVSALLLTALSIAREREVGTFDQLIVSPLSSAEILAGKAAPALLIAWCITMFMIIMSVIFFKFPLNGSVPLFLLADLIALLALVGVGLFISSLCKTQQQAVLGVFVFQMPAVLLSGFISPIDNMPPLLQSLTMLNPLRFFMVIAKGILLKNMGVSDVMVNLIPLAIIAVLTLSVAGWSFKRNLE